MQRRSAELSEVWDHGFLPSGIFDALIASVLSWNQRVSLGNNVVVGEAITEACQDAFSPHFMRHGACPGIGGRSR